MRNLFPAALPALVIGMGLAFGATIHAVAGEPGIAGHQDARIKTNFYDPAEVYRVVSHFGFVTSIQFEKGESVESVQLGDSVSWSVERLARGDMLSIVPLEETARGTNMTVTTDQRVYVFDMVARHAASPDAPEMTFLYRFDYPVTAEDLAAQEAARIEKAQQIDGFEDAVTAAKAKGAPLNGAYRAIGDPLLTPASMIDDGAKTYLRFREGAGHPAVFHVARDASESSVNTSTLPDGTLVIHRTGRAFTLRGRDGSTVCIFNDALLALEQGPKAKAGDRQVMAMVATAAEPSSSDEPQADRIAAAFRGFLTITETETHEGGER